MNIVLGSWKGFLGQGLAPRELQCVLAVANGKTVKEAAQILGMAPSTTAKRIASAMFKLGVKRQAAMVAAAFAQGIISFACTSPADPDQQHDQDKGHHGVLLA
ncbi:helix-turn-helix transcriptional regulator [Pseudomonas alliivorans]|nr:helix-turn-helix transcriptional regulator [Pseudomonas alliivorans]